MTRLRFIPAGLILAASMAHGAAPDAPDWLRQALLKTTPSYPAKVTSLVLFQEEAVTVDPDGRRVMRERGAIRILQPNGNHLSAYRTYDTKNGRIRDFRGWLVDPGGKARPYPKSSILDVAISRDYVYDDTRAKALECGPARPGSVFAWKVTEEEKTLFTQYRYAFQEQSPVLESRFSLALPAGWEAKSVIFNHDALEPQVSGNSYTWVLRDLPRIEDEEYSPSLAALAPRLAVSYFPPSDNRGGLQGLKDWTAVSMWLSPMIDPPAEVTPTVRAKAQQLTANAAGELDKIRAIASFVQQTNYVEVLLNLTRGGGYIPHRADETLAKNYGDCKDKATLMRALLKAAGIDSYLVVISANDRTYVRPEWASPGQFNHAIVGVQVSGAVKLPTVLEDNNLGRLLIFDPTDRITRVGDLPEDEQGSHALVIAGTRGALLTMPLLPASANRVEGTVEGTLSENGRLEAKVERQYFGQSSVPLRAVETLRGGDDLKKRFERGFGRRLGGSTVGSVTTDVHAEENNLAVHVGLSAERFAQLQAKLFITRPGLLTSGGDYSFTTKTRTAPIKLDADMRRDSIRLKLPAGFKVDEVPAAAKIESAYGKLEARWTVKSDELVMEQTLEVNEMSVPAAEYAKVRDFFERVAGAQDAPVVLVKQ